MAGGTIIRELSWIYAMLTSTWQSSMLRKDEFSLLIVARQSYAKLVLLAHGCYKQLVTVASPSSRESAGLELYKIVNFLVHLESCSLPMDFFGYRKLTEISRGRMKCIFEMLLSRPRVARHRIFQCL